MSIQNKNNVVLNEKSVEGKPCINRESKSNDITIKLYSCSDINIKLLEFVTPPFIYHTILIKKVVYYAITIMCIVRYVGVK